MRALPGAALALAAALLALPAAANPEATWAVDIRNFAYDPETLVVHMGDTVVWTNRDVAEHTVTAWDFSFHSGYLRQGESFAHTFELPGVYLYRCQPHFSMFAEVVVLP